MFRMHSERDEDVADGQAGDIVAFFGVECASGETFTDGKVKCTLTSMHVPAAVISLAVAPKERTGAGQLLQGAQPLHQGRSDLPRAPGRGVRADHHQRHGRAPPRHLHRAHAARVQLRRHRRQAAGRVPRDDHPARRVQLHAQEADRRLRSVRAGSCGYIEPLPADAVETYEFVDDVTGGSIPREFISGVRQGLQGGDQEGHADRLPDRRRALRGQRRRQPRGRLVRAGVQDRRDHGLPRGLRTRPSRPSSSRS